MQFTVDSHPTDIRRGESLLSVVRRLGLDCESLAERPLAASFSGEIFTLNYIPQRTGDLTPISRRSIRASGGKISLIRYNDMRGKRVYERTLLFVFFLAMRELFPLQRVRIGSAVGAGIYASFADGTPITADDILRIRHKMREIVSADYTLERRRLDIDDAISVFASDGQTDKVRLLEWRNLSYFDVYQHGDYLDYFYGEMAPSTGYASVFNLQHESPGLLLVRPSDENPDVPANRVKLPILLSVFKQSDDWNRLMRCDSVADLNAMVLDGSVRTLIRVNEALHEKRFAELADEIIARGARAVMIAGPSSSGKTTSANRLCTQLRVHGKTPILFSLDDYYIDRDKCIPDENGEIDLEHINTIDVPLFREHLKKLLNGEVVEVPRFDFNVQKRVWDGRTLHIDENTPLVIEGLHALNPAMMPEGIDANLVFRLYVSALTTLNLDDHNRIPTTQLRQLRRIVRDYDTRSTSVEETLARWDSVRRGEERWIFPYQESADAVFNTTLIYEAAVMKKHVFPLLTAVKPDSPYYDQVRAIVKFLNYFVEADVEDEIPPTSILREFVGGCTFYR